ncbi:dihydroxy-acid dehydratase [Fictibacillus enclensis]|uniref:Dihydroxy-acid dehydratase n=1 Tax=Fictibacillus enclensis TaxID=1017270 RepID=A0A0V8J4P2_9BACL|nr:IlvD/Edd family dehydratase [Fictibacillus enclensis]KSU82126.1 dihydroxy-acid dehydratase [Fictibacillus enclensis]SCC30655.1 dihydroxy-acid dehydratase [Fictibacillus enclensis]
MKSENNKKLTSYGDPGFSEFIRQAFNRHLGFDQEDFKKPVIGICNTKSEINRCHTHIGPLIEAVKKGVLMAGGIPLEFPTISLGEINTSPTTMLYRNLAAMDTEEMIRAQPIDGVVLVGGCDKVTPSQLMGAASADIPSIMITGGPMNNGEYEGRTLGACSDCRFFWQEFRGGSISEQEKDAINKELAPTAGHCMVMGSASTMAVCAEALGMMLPGGAAIPATHNRRLKHAMDTGKKIVELTIKGIKPSQIMTENTFDNAIRALMAVGGSTNAVIHLIAIAGRLGIKLPLERFDQLSRTTPFIANLRPAGKYQMEDFYKAGGAPAVLKELESILNVYELTVTGTTLKENLEGVTVSNVYRDIIYPFEQPLHKEGGIAVLKGNLAPNGAVIKPKAASKELLHHRGRAVVFSSTQELEKLIDDPSLDVQADDILVLQNAGPVGAPGMPEAGMLPIPQSLLKKGVRDMIRISDARMSGTAFGTVILHVAPESAVGGPIGLIKTGDLIEVDVEARRIQLLVSDEELANRKQQWSPPVIAQRGYAHIYQKHVMQADEGCDFDFLLAPQKEKVR